MIDLLFPFSISSVSGFCSRLCHCNLGEDGLQVTCVRDLAEGADVATLELEHYPGVTEVSVRKVAEEALGRWPIDALTIVHRVGELGPADQIVLVLTASAHRHAAYDANRFGMDYLKTRAVFWKKEHRADGAYWIESRPDDHTAAADWRTHAPFD